MENEKRFGRKFPFDKNASISPENLFREKNAMIFADKREASSHNYIGLDTSLESRYK